jgi:hypothetical protein
MTSHHKHIKHRLRSWIGCRPCTSNYAASHESVTPQVHKCVSWKPYCSPRTGLNTVYAAPSVGTCLALKVDAHIFR